MNKKTDVLIKFLLALLSIVGIIFLVISLYRVGSTKCYYELHTFLYDEILESDLCIDNECLFIYTLNETNGYKKLFFGDEKRLYSKRTNTDVNDLLRIKWCQTNVGFRIRGIRTL